MLQTKVFQETFLSVFSNFLHFNESLPMKSYQFFKIYIRLFKKREKTFKQQSSRKEKLRKFGLSLFLAVYFMTLKIAYNHFFFNRSFCWQYFFYFVSLFTAHFLFFDVRMMQKILKVETRNYELAKNSKLEYLFQK